MIEYRNSEYNMPHLGINHKLLEYSVFSMVLMIPSLSPVINIYFIRPYRSEVNYLVQKDDQLYKNAKLIILRVFSDRTLDA